LSAFALVMLIACECRHISRPTWGRRQSATASRRRLLNGDAAPIETGPELHAPARTNWRLNSA
jgi:hypothetical protein